MTSYRDFFRKALADPEAEPHPHQQVLGDKGLPTVLTAPTGTGKTEAAIIGHLYRRHGHPEESVRSSTPRWLVVALPTRGLVEQTLDRIGTWVENLGLAGQVDVHAVMGGEGWDDRAWRSVPEHDAVFVGTVDMLLSRALNRGYADSRWSWPISFGLFNNGTQWVFDEVQQMELATVNSRQLQAFRDSLGTLLPTQSMWMSATLDEDLLRTVDAPEIASHVDAVSLGDPPPAMQQRLTAEKTVRELHLEDPKQRSAQVADQVLALHSEAVSGAGRGVLTIVVLNTVGRAQELYRHLTRSDTSADCLLLHRQFRPAERRRHTELALAPVAPDGAGRIVVSTQVLEAGIDVDASVLVTELAPWSSIVQRAGRCNRAGRTDGAVLGWVDLTEKEAPPYEAEDLAAARESLRSLEGSAVTPQSLAATGPPPRRRIHHVLRRRDLFELFDTSADLSGDALDVSQFIRDGEERDIHLAWRDDPNEEMDTPRTDELCPVPVSGARTWLRSDKHELWVGDAQRGRWRRAREADLRPGHMLVANAGSGGYDPDLGWAPKSNQHVEPLLTGVERAFGNDMGVEADPASMIGTWYGLDDHLADVDRVANKVIDAIAPDLATPLRQACVHAAALHDLGKAHHVWQRAALAAGGEQPRPDELGLIAKTPGRGRLRFEQPHFRHELTSLIALRGHASALLDGTHEPELCCYLVAAHHGRVRLTVRSLPGESAPNGQPVVLGVVDGSELPEVQTPLGPAPGGPLPVAAVAASWTREALALRDRPDLGPFRLAFLEAVVRLADWEASRQITDVEAGA
ncbi:MAG: CRISPR-associated endonuclease Cas3'' [Acidimicrobiales bacterium]